MNIWKKSLMARLAGYFLLLSLLTVSLAGYIAYRKATSLIKESVFERVDAVATLKEDDLNQWVENQRKSIVLLAHLPEVRQQAAIVLRHEHHDDDYAYAYELLSETLDALAAGNSDVQEIFILTDTSGCVIVSTRKTNEGTFRAQDTYFIKGRESTYIQSVYASPVTFRPMMSIATPLVDKEGIRMGVIAAHINLDRLDTIMLERTGLGQSGEIYLIDTLNAFVSSKSFGREKFYRSVHTEGIHAALAGNNGTGLYTNYNDVPVIGAYRWVDYLQLALLVEMSQQEALAPARRLAWSILLIGSSTAWILTVGVYVLSRQITRPILAITDAAGKIAEGDLTSKAPVLTEDEVGKLAHTFNQMTNELRTLYHSLRTQQEHLEEQVTQRTQELSRINTMLINEVAERKQTEKALQKAKESAEAANRAKSTFLANMSHELRTPLNAIIGFTQLMGRDKGLAPEHMERLHIVERSGEHLLDLINDVLEMSKIEAGRTTLQQQKFDLHTLLQDLTHMFSLRAKSKNLHLYQNLDADIPKHVYADEGKLRQILINLLSNAIKFTTSGSITLRVGVEPAHFPTTHRPRRQLDQEQLAHTVCILRFEIEDTGVGIAADELPSLFDAFVQTSSGQKSKEGTGLGLSISQHFVRMMGGSLHVQSDVGQGSTFTCIVPLSVVPSADVAAHKPAQHIVGLAPNQPHYRILIVEDMDDSRKLMTDLLVPLGFDVKEASNGQEGIEVWETWAPHLIFMDIRMPVMDGYMATKYIKESAKDTKPAIIALTASAFEEQRHHMLAIGCDDFIRKPFQQSDMLNVMQKHIGVQFLYEQSTTPETYVSHDAAHLMMPASDRDQQGASVTFQIDSALATLPDTLLDDLSKATIETNPDMIDTVVNTIRTHNHTLADALLALANDFEYASILALIQEARGKDA